MNFKLQFGQKLPKSTIINCQHHIGGLIYQIIILYYLKLH
jgi:hypothetical protein